MANVKFMVMYPRPKDIEAFDKLYQEEHIPMAVEKLAGKTKFVATKILPTPEGTPPPFYRIAEVHFPSLEALQACAVCGWQRNPRPCRQDLERWRPGVPGRGRTDIYVWQSLPIGTAQGARLALKEDCVL
ncbi:MAG: EthD family reductase [Gammaproteobacteria bacterium]